MPKSDKSGPNRLTAKALTSSYEVSRPAPRNGLYAALLARGGYTGIEGVFEQPYGGYLSTFGEGHDPEIAQITMELGERWETERIVVKPYAAMGGLYAATGHGGAPRQHSLRYGTSLTIDGDIVRVRPA